MGSKQTEAKRLSKRPGARAAKAAALGTPPIAPSPSDKARGKATKATKATQKPAPSTVPETQPKIQRRSTRLQLPQPSASDSAPIPPATVVKLTTITQPPASITPFGSDRGDTPESELDIGAIAGFADEVTAETDIGSPNCEESFEEFNLNEIGSDTSDSDSEATITAVRPEANPGATAAPKPKNAGGAKRASKAPVGKQGGKPKAVERILLTAVKFSIPKQVASAAIATFTTKFINLETSTWPSVKNQITEEMPYTMSTQVALGYQVVYFDAKMVSKDWEEIGSEREWNTMVDRVRAKTQAESRKAAGREIVVKIRNLADVVEKGKGGKSNAAKKPVTLSRAAAHNRTSLDSSANDSMKEPLETAPSLTQEQKITLKIADINKTYKCDSRECNGGPCWKVTVGDQTDHHKLTKEEVLKWAGQIVSNNATIDKPPLDKVHVTDARRAVKLRPQRANAAPSPPNYPYTPHFPIGYPYIWPSHDFPPIAYSYSEAYAGLPSNFSRPAPLPATGTAWHDVPVPAISSSQANNGDDSLEFPLIKAWLKIINDDLTNRNKNSKNFAAYIPVFEKLEIVRIDELLEITTQDLVATNQVPLGIAKDLIKFAKEDVEWTRDRTAKNTHGNSSTGGDH
ncbi:hypothetical protein BOTBODRAFT_176204 [Botryobasidium botryosum FD-172 SS1]|uniref:SAM domain-containing protein n=1 Tax=Botryobasidium botryosum (strain FD-172 SS1) TaxID=930990 RepID=A0A067MLP1_BOTB1|nr:hypothetical protein BOTBODRAFT_176204 [Botryobasidium botryosum FD-172 SS1]